MWRHDAADACGEKWRAFDRKGADEPGCTSEPCGRQKMERNALCCVRALPLWSSNYSNRTSRSRRTIFLHITSMTWHFTFNLRHLTHKAHHNMPSYKMKPNPPYWTFSCFFTCANKIFRFSRVRWAGHFEVVVFLYNEGAWLNKPDAMGAWESRSVYLRALYRRQVGALFSFSLVILFRCVERIKTEQIIPNIAT